MRRQNSDVIVRAFTVKYDKITNVLLSPCGISTAVDSIEQRDIHEVTALWDTGATHTCISASCVAASGLIPTGSVQVRGIHGARIVDTHLINLWLPNQVCIERLLVAGVNLEDFDLLVGMDVINTGDFAISNRGQQTVFTFRMPSRQRFDFANDARRSRQTRLR